MKEKAAQEEEMSGEDEEGLEAVEGEDVEEGEGEDDDEEDDDEDYDDEYDSEEEDENYDPKRDPNFLPLMEEKFELQPEDQETVIQGKKKLMEHELRREVKYFNEGNRSISEKQLEAILETMIKMEFETEEQMTKYFKHEFTKIVKDSDFAWTAKRNMKPFVNNDEQSKIDLRDRDFERGGRSWSLRKYALTKTELYREWEKQLQSMGRYPHGFRHYENYVNYRTVFPDATIEDYMKDMNRECTYAEFLNIMKAFITQRTRENRYRLKFRLRRWQRHNPLNDEKRKKRIDQIVQKFIASEKFEQKAQKKFRKLQYEKMVNKKIFTLVDCLEEVMDLWTIGRNFNDIPNSNLFIPTKTTLMTKPKFIEAEDEMGFRLINRDDKKTTTPRIDPTLPLNPLKGVKLMPNKHTVELYKEEWKLRKPYFKLRRLSEFQNPFGKTSYKQTRLFSTSTRDPVAQVNPFRHFFATQELNASPFRQ